MSVISCTSDSDCDFNFYCSNDQCVHDSLWPPTALDIITYCLIPVIVGVGNVGGLGGGIVKVPMLMLMLNYQSKVATFISYCILFGSCLANSTLLIFKKHPLKNKPIIDYNIVLIINPMVLLGTNIGIFLNILLPEVAAGILFIVFLTSISPYMFKKGLNLYRLKKESQKCDLEQKLLEVEEDVVGEDKDEDNYQEAAQNNQRCNDSMQDNLQLTAQNQQINGPTGNSKRGSLDDQRTVSNKNLLNIKTNDVEEVESILPQNHRNHIKNKSLKSSQHQITNVLKKSAYVEEMVNVENCNSYFQPDETPQDNLKRQSIIISHNAIKESAVDQNKIYIDSSGNEEIDAFYHEEYRQVPWKKLTLLIIIFFSVQMLVFLRGGKGLSSFVGIKVCSVAYWITNVMIVVVAFIAAFVIRYFLMKWEGQKKQIIEKYNLQHEFEGDFDCNNPLRYLKISIAGLTAGALAGTFGVGAGLALVPILLASGVHPQVAAATCGFNYFFISTTTIIQVFTNSYLDVAQIVLFSILSFIGGFVFAKIIYTLVEKKKASYVVVFIVFGLAILNIISFIVYLTKKGIMYGWDSLVNQTPFCQAQ